MTAMVPAFAPQESGYGEVGLAEVCLHVRDVHRVFDELVENQGCEPLMSPLNAAVPPDDITLEIGVRG